MKTTRVTDTMKLLRINREEHSVFLGKTFMATLDGGKHRFPKHFTEKVTVIDNDLFNHLVFEIKIGDEIEVTTETQWPSLETHLVRFTRVGGARNGD